MCIGPENDNSRNNRLHVDYAQAREDQYEYECNQRALHRQMRHQERLNLDKLRPPSPPVIIHYSEHEAQQVMEKLRGELTFWVIHFFPLVFRFTFLRTWFPQWLRA